MATKHFFNNADDLVVDCLESLVLTNEELLLDRENKVVFTRSHDSTSCVSLIAGGGAGHEPANAGFVGNGMLTGSVSGFVFASPSVTQIVSALRHVGGKAGTVLIIMNYTGDVFHFHLAAEKFQANYGLPVEVVVVGDDVSVGRKKSGKVGRRGLAGTVLVHKILGSMSSTPGITLTQLAEAGRLVVSNLVTVGTSLGHVHVPGRGAAAVDPPAASDSVELGMGIHNEIGCRVLSPRPDLPSLVDLMLDQLLDQKDTDRGYVDMNNAEEIVLLVNNLGSVSELEFGGIATQVVKALGIRGFKLSKVLSGTYMTSLDGPGFSITLLKATTEMLKHIDAPTTASGWKPARNPNLTPTREAVLALDALHVTSGSDEAAARLSLDSHAFTVAVTNACKKLIDNEPSITYFDTIVGDGDCGTTLARGAAAVLKWLQSGKVGSNAVETMLRLTEVIENGMDGTSGAIYTIFFAALTSALKSLSSTHQSLDSRLWASAAEKALVQLRLATPARQGDRTLMDALEPFIHSLSIGSDLNTAAAEAKKGAESTIGMIAVFGRAVYVDDSVWKDVPDPGAMGIVSLVDGLAGDSLV